MIEMGIGAPGEGGMAASADDTPADTSAGAANPCSYCGECGSWGAHGARCVSCGYDFYAEPIDNALD